MKNFVVESGDYISTSGIYRMNDHPGREVTLIYGDAVPRDHLSECVCLRIVPVISLRGGGLAASCRPASSMPRCCTCKTMAARALPQVTHRHRGLFRQRDPEERRR
jgi:hypothetical protein